ncbi:MAG: alpha-L-fucosidase [Treponema sp.]|jgi:alpha-L-fucosidase|nr:alpha-L-fucosidase [Treponema sp.]
MNITPKPWSQLTDFHTPKWLRDNKFGIYTHWGVYSVAAFGPNVSWYPNLMYQEGTAQYEYHCKTFGHPSKVGYKDLIPKFDGSKFDADEWAEIFSRAGAKFAGPVAEHHDGFALWDSKLTKWNAKQMGPKRDVVGELEKSYRNRGMEFLAAFHHAENWRFYPHWVKEYDCSDPRYTGLYGEPHNLEWGSEKRYAPQPGFGWNDQDLPTKVAHELWLGKLVEVAEAYNPDFVWFDFGLDFIVDYYKRAFLTYYFDRAADRKQDVAVSYKWNHLPVGAGLIDLELGRFNEITYHDWITDTTVDDGQAWGYMQDAQYKSSTSLIHYLIDNVSKNGYMLLNVGPKPNGEIPEEAKKVLYDIGAWLEVNGEAVYGTTPWVVAEEGPTVLKKSGPFNEDKIEYLPKDIRFTLKDDVIYASCLGEIGDEVIINSLAEHMYPGEIASISLLGDGGELPWKQEGKRIIVRTERAKGRKDANVLKIRRNRIYRDE